jgi:hypothetical protein
MLKPVRCVVLAVTLCSAAVAEDLKQVQPPAVPAVPVSAKKLDELKRKYPVTITIDTSETPEFRDWAAAAQTMGKGWYPWIADQLSTPGYVPPNHIKVKIYREYDGAAATGGDEISMAAKWFTAHPDDMGALFHEFVHVVQSYPSYRPSWLVEGIADYLRWFNYEPVSARPKVNPDRAKYSDGYRTTGAFLDWIVRHRASNAVRRLNAVMRADTYSDDTSRKVTGYDLDTLWAQYTASLRTASE